MKPTIFIAIVFALLSVCVSAQSLKLPKGMDDFDVFDLKDQYDKQASCSSVDRDEVFGNKVKYLWFNDYSILDSSRLLQEILTKFPEEKLDQMNLRWKPGDKVHPFRRLDSSGSDSQWIAMDKDDREDLERNVLQLGNGFSAGKWFQLSVDRTHSEFISRLAVKMSGTDLKLASFLYSGALRYYRCDVSVTDEIFLDRTEITVEGDDLVIVTRLPRGSVYKLLPIERQ